MARTPDATPATLFTSDTVVLEMVARLLPAQKTGLLATGLTTESEINQLTAEIEAAMKRPLRRSTSVIFVDAIGEIPG